MHFTSSNLLYDFPNGKYMLCSLLKKKKSSCGKYGSTRPATQLVQPNPLVLPCLSVSTSPGTDKSVLGGSHLVPFDTSSDGEFAVLLSYSKFCPRTSKTWGTSEKWVLKLRDERRGDIN